MQKLHRYRPVKKQKKQKANIKTLANKIQGYLGELKYGTSTYTNTVSYTGTIQSLCDISQGDSDTTRDGDSLTISSLELRGFFVAGDAYNVCRVMLVQWFPTDGVAPTISQILVNTGNLYASISVKAHDYRQQFKVLYDKILVVNTYNPTKMFYKKVYPKRRKIQYVAGTNTGNNKIYIIMISDSSAVSHPSVYYDNKILFKDS